MLSRREFLAAGSAAVPFLSWPLGGAQTANFLLGTATSAYQVEGAIAADGKGESVWDEFVLRPGAIAGGASGAKACDFYHQFQNDIAIMGAMACNAFRFSVAWTRVLPQGTGAVNQRGLDFYRRLVDALLAAGIEPVLTLFHWDTPVALDRRGGWRTPEMVEWFGAYAAVVARALGDRVRWWLTINEPRSFIGGGYVAGVQAPGLRLERKHALAAAHHVLLAHGRAVQAIRAEAGRAAKVGIPNDCTPVLPTAGVEAETARAATFATPLENFTARGWWNENAWWHEPIYRGAYPAAALAALGPDAPKIAAGDGAAIAQPLDFLAANVYAGRTLSGAWPARTARTGFGWPVTPEALYWAPRWLHERYRLPVFVTENGCSEPDGVAPDGAVHDTARQQFTGSYVAALRRAMADGTPVLGYLYWSLLDNFEWQAGYTQRFGLVYVDFDSERRVVKDSGRRFVAIR